MSLDEVGGPGGDPNESDPDESDDVGSEDAVVERVRGDLARLGADARSAPPVPAAVTARLVAALRAAPPRRAPTHSDRPATSPWSRGRILALVAGVGAAVIGSGLGIHLLLAAAPSDDSPRSGAAGSAREAAAKATAGLITVTRPPQAVPMTDTQILELLSRRPVYGTAGDWLADSGRRSECLRALGYPAATEILGAAPITMAGRAAVLVVLPGDTAQTVVAVVPAPTCGMDGPQRWAETEVVKR